MTSSAAAQPTLGDGDEVGLNSGVLGREKAPGTAKARLDLVDDHDDPMRIADAAKFLQELVGRGIEPAFALHRLDQNCRDVARRDIHFEQVMQRL